MGYQDSGNRSCAFHNGNHNGDNYGNNKTIQKMWNEISQMFLIGSLSGIAVLGYEETIEIFNVGLWRRMDITDCSGLAISAWIQCDILVKTK